MSDLMELKDLCWRGLIKGFNIKWILVLMITGLMFFSPEYTCAQENEVQDNTQELLKLFDDIIYDNDKNAKKNNRNKTDKKETSKSDTQDLLNVFDEALNENSSSDTSSSQNLLKIYVDGSHIDPAFLRKQIPYVNFVRDPNLSDVQILVTSITTASSGREYRLNYIGRKDFSRINFELEHSSYQDETDHTRRERLINVIKMGLIPYISQTPSKEQMKLDYDMQGKTIAEVADEQEDPWNYWVIELSGNGSFYKEQTYKSFNLSGSIEVDKITENWKIQNDLSTSEWHRTYYDDDGIESSSSINSYKRFSTSVVKSLSDHWSTGLSAGVHNSTYSNIDLSYSVGPAIEYNIFPWEEVDRRTFTLAYRIGIRENNYIEETIYGKFNEMLSYESLTVSLRMIQKWGDIRLTLSGSHYFENLEWYSAQLNSSFDVRLTKNLSFYANLRLESVHNQVYLPIGELTEEERLLRQRAMATTYEISIGGGFRFRFGSIYNNIVNRRL
ncbi:hypothetical protein ACFLU5_02605 [Bacteroidota bacterium]